MFVDIFAKETASSILVGVIAALIVTILFHLKKLLKYPPGPYGLPFIGYLPFLTRNLHLKLTELAKKYGPVYSLTIGTKTVVILSDYRSIKKAFSQDDTMGRPPDVFFDINKVTMETGAFTDLAWKDQRRYALHRLRDLGFGKSKMESLVQEEIEELLERFEKEGGKPILTGPYLTPSASNNIASFMFGKRRKFDDPKRVMLDRLFNENRDLVGVSILLTFFPILRTLCRILNIGSQGHSVAIEKQMQNYMKEEVQEHKDTLDPNNIRDYIDGYLLEIEKKKDDPHSSFKEPVLEDLVLLFFGAGSETIRQVVEWLILNSAAHPEVQKRVQSEIETVIGSERFPSRIDYIKMPYTEAVIHEMYRWRAALPINLPRYTLEDTEIGSHFVPKHTQVIAVFWAVHHNADLWGEDVDEFNPKRFLSEDETQVRKPEYYMPFSSGKRACPGEALANVTVFMYYTAILQKFNVSLPEGVTPDLEGELLFGLQAKPHKIRFASRK